MIEIVTADQVMLCLYKRLEFTEHLRRGWKGWEMITILSNNSAKRLGKHHQFSIFWLVFVFYCSGNPVQVLQLIRICRIFEKIVSGKSEGLRDIFNWSSQMLNANVVVLFYCSFYIFKKYSTRQNVQFTSPFSNIFLSLIRLFNI